MPRTPLLHPDEYFERSPPAREFGLALAIAVAVALATTAGVGVVGWAFAGKLDVQVTVDNPAHAPDWACDDEFSDIPTPEGCAPDVPETTQVNLGQQVWEEFTGYLPLVFVLGVLAWPVVAAVLHGLSALAGGEGSLAGTLTVAAWASVPELVRVVGASAYVVWRIQRITLPREPEAAVERLRTLTEFGTQAPVLVLGILVTAWQAYIWTHGLRHARSLSLGAAARVAGVAALGAILVDVLG